MKTIEGNASVQKFFFDNSYRWDMWAFFGVCAFSLFGLASLGLGLNLIYLREFNSNSNAAILLIFSPAIVFLMWICTALLPLSKSFASRFLRICIYIVFVLVFNF